MPDSKCAFEEQGCLYKDDCAEGESSAEKPEISNNKKNSYPRKKWQNIKHNKVYQNIRWKQTLKTEEKLKL